MGEAQSKLQQDVEEIKVDVKTFKIDADTLAKTLIQLQMDVAYIRENMYTKAEHYEFMTKMDEFMTEMRSTREERVLRENQTLRMDDQLANHELRLKVLEQA